MLISSRIHAVGAVGAVSPDSAAGAEAAAAQVDAGRRRLIRALGAGLLLAPLGGLLGGCGAALGRRPEPLPPSRSVWRAEGAFRVNGSAAAEDAMIRPGDLVETDAAGNLVFAVGETAFLARPSSRIRLLAADDAPTRVGTIRVEAGALLTVFAPRTYRVETPLAVIGIRGTGLYAAVESGRDYVCTCYGAVDLAARADASSREAILTTRHDSPRYVTADGAAGSRIRTAPFRDHTDEELLLIESLVGRMPPYPVRGDAYGMPRRRAY